MKSNMLRNTVSIKQLINYIKPFRTCIKINKLLKEYICNVQMADDSSVARKPSDKTWLETS